MIVFGLISSIFDYLTFGVLLYIMNADEKLFQTGWFMESVVSAVLIVLVMRTRRPFFKSLPGKYLAAATALIFAFVVILPYLPFSALLGFKTVQISFYGWMLLIVAAYIVSAELAKHWFFKRAGNL